MVKGNFYVVTWLSFAQLSHAALNHVTVMASLLKLSVTNSQL